ncbi:MAG: phytanoyl-CoA dioxygenase family protein [Pseudomonadota bacterium]
MTCEMMITEQQASAFHDQGFLVVERLFDSAALAAIHRAIDTTLDRFDQSAHRSVFSTEDRDQGRDEVFFRSAERVEYFLEEDALDDAGTLTRPLPLAINKIGHALHDHMPEIGALARDPRIGDTLRTLGQERPTLWQSMVIFKQPGIGGAVRWHQDASYLHTAPASVIGVWLALEDATLDNGCLLVAPGQHQSPLRERYRVDWAQRCGTLETLDAMPWPEDGEGHAVEVPEGTLVLFSDHLPHASSHNHSANSRRALTFHTSDAASSWSSDNWLQRPTLPLFRL